jgi:hypothetical protein
VRVPVIDLLVLTLADERDSGLPFMPTKLRAVVREILLPVMLTNVDGCAVLGLALCIAA